MTLAEFSRKGGRSRSPKKQAAVRNNLALARAKLRKLRKAKDLQAKKKEKLTHKAVCEIV